MASGSEDTDQVVSPASDPIERILSRAPGASKTTVIRDTAGNEPTLGELDLEERYALRRVQGLSTELEDITEVEYRQLRLENVVLIGVYPQARLKRPRTRFASSRCCVKRPEPPS